MKNTYTLQVQRADNGFVAIAQNDEPGIKQKKIVATSEKEIIDAMKGLIDHMFDEAEKPKEEVKK